MYWLVYSFLHFFEKNCILHDWTSTSSCAYDTPHTLLTTVAIYFRRHLTNLYLTFSILYRKRKRYIKISFQNTRLILQNKHVHIKSEILNGENGFFVNKWYWDSKQNLNTVLLTNTGCYTFLNKANKEMLNYNFVKFSKLKHIPNFFKWHASIWAISIVSLNNRHSLQKNAL